MTELPYDWSWQVHQAFNDFYKETQIPPNRVALHIEWSAPYCAFVHSATSDVMMGLPTILQNGSNITFANVNNPVCSIAYAEMENYIGAQHG